MRLIWNTLVVLFFSHTTPTLAALSVTAVGNSFTNLRVMSSPNMAGGVIARVNYFCGTSVWDGVTATVTQQNQVVTIAIPSSFQFLCFATPAPPADFDIALGTLPAGNYTLRMQESPPPGETTPIALIETNFSIHESPPLSNLRVVPVPASAGTPVAARVLYTCTRGTHGAPTISRSDNAIRLVFTDVGLESCFDGVPPPPFDETFNLGAFPPGNYTVYLQQLPTTPNLVIPTLSAPLVVYGSTTNPAPANNPRMLGTLFMLMLGIGVWAMQKSSLSTGAGVG